MSRNIIVLGLVFATLVFAILKFGGSDLPAPGEVYVPPSVIERAAVNGHVDVPAVGWFESGCQLPFEMVRRIKRGYYAGRSPDLLFTANMPNQYPNSHSGPWDYLSKVPLLLYGPGYIKAQGSVQLNREVTLADLAPTYAELLGTEFPEDRAGHSLSEILVPAEEREAPPKLILTVVWDGGGMNVLNAHPDSWPVLKGLEAGGTFLEGADTGSSPTITPAVHANIGTGTFPEQHGSVDIKLVLDGQLTGAADKKNPASLQVDTFADIYDQSTGNAAKIGVFAYKAWHEAMIGRGAAVEGGDKDIAALVDHDSKMFANEDLYTLPPYLNQITGLDHFVDVVDEVDGKMDSQWLDNAGVLDDKDLVRKSPAWALFQTKILKTLLTREGFGRDDVPDLFFTNYKQIDEVGHQWSMLEEEMADVIKYSDAQLQLLVDFLNKRVGEGKWVMAVTADHGPAPDVVPVGGWVIRLLPFIEDMAAHFGVTPEELELDHRVGGDWPITQTLIDNGFTLQDMANFIINYRIKDNADGEVPEAYADRADEPVFSAAWPAVAMDAVYACSKARHSQ